MPLQPGPTTTRRTALAVAGTVLVATACGPGANPAAAPEDPDADLLAEATTGIVVLAELVRDARRAFPRLRGPLAALAAMHRAHLDALPGRDRPTGEVEDPATDAQARLDAVRTQELTLARHLRRAAVAAQSGPLARLLASMAAGVEAHVADLPVRVAA